MALRTKEPFDVGVCCWCLWGLSLMIRMIGLRKSTLRHRRSYENYKTFPKGVPAHIHRDALPEELSAFGPMDLNGEEGLNLDRDGPRIAKLPPGMPPAPLPPGMPPAPRKAGGPSAPFGPALALLYERCVAVAT